VRRRPKAARRSRSRRATPSSLTHRIYQAIRESILESPGGPSTLAERDLAKQYGVSKTPVREALIRLAQEGFIEISPRRGISIPKISVEDLKEVFGVRSALEGLAAEEAARNVPTAALRTLKDEFHAAAEDKDGPRLYELGEALHNLIMAACNNKRLTSVVGTMRAQIVRYSRLASRLPEQMDRSYRDHLGIIEALEHQDPAGARRAIEDHIKGVKENLIRSVL
jgi:DNA-binding GntR family transcriptional regulator